MRWLKREISATTTGVSLWLHLLIFAKFQSAQRNNCQSTSGLLQQQPFNDLVADSLFAILILF